jgi:hypothetical protein
MLYLLVAAQVTNLARLRHSIPNAIPGLPGLYIGAVCSALNTAALRALGITHVLTVAGPEIDYESMHRLRTTPVELPPNVKELVVIQDRPPLTYLKLDVLDVPEQNMLDVLPAAFEVIDAALRLRALNLMEIKARRQRLREETVLPQGPGSGLALQENEVQELEQSRGGIHGDDTRGGDKVEIDFHSIPKTGEMLSGDTSQFQIRMVDGDSEEPNADGSVDSWDRGRGEDARRKEDVGDASVAAHYAAEGPGGVLVHCRVGMSRSATICIAYVMRHLGLPLEAAQRLVREGRPVTMPNPGFQEQLLRYEHHLREQGAIR